MENRRQVAIEKNRLEYAKKLEKTISALEFEGQALGVQIAHKRKDIGQGHYEEAKERKEEIEIRRDDIYK